jgi:di/tripeptidase
MILGKILYQPRKSKRESRVFDQLENNLLIRRFDEGMELNQIANKHNRTQKEIKKQLLKLGKLPSSSPKLERAGQKWEIQEDKLLSERFESGMNISQLAEKHQRTKGAIIARLVRIDKLDRNN